MSSVWMAALQALPILVVLVALYRLFLRPLRRQIVEHKKLMKKLKPGDSVVTETGILGKVDALIEPDIVRLWIAPDRFIALKRAGISEFVEPLVVERAWTRDG